MLQFFLNPWLLLGLLGVALPIMAHLLSRRRFDIVEWGAMQFLNPADDSRWLARWLPIGRFANCRNHHRRFEFHVAF